MKRLNPLIIAIECQVSPVKGMWNSGMPDIYNRSGYPDKSIDNIQCCPNSAGSSTKYMIYIVISVSRAAHNQHGISLLGLHPRRLIETGITV